MSKPKLYSCSYCGMMLQHKDVHRHVQHECKNKPKGKR